MDHETFEAAARVMLFLEANMKDVPVPQSVEEDAALVEEWFEDSERRQVACEFCDERFSLYTSASDGTLRSAHRCR